MDVKLKADLADLLFDAGCVEIDLDNGFRLKEHEVGAGPLSPVRFNLRTNTHPSAPGPLSADELPLIGQALAEKLELAEVRFDRILGLPSAGEPLAGALAKALGGGEELLLHLHKTTLPRGQRLIVGPLEGSYEPGQRILLLDDVISRSRSKMEARNILARKGFFATDLVVVIDRGQGGTELMRQVGITVHSLFSAQELLDRGVSTGRISSGSHQVILRYLASSKL